MKATGNIDATSFLSWTEIDGDLEGVKETEAQAIRQMRMDFSVGDAQRAAYWQVPDGVDVLADIPYLDDDLRGHLLDICLPHDAVVRDGHALPVIVDIHGGGFVYGYKDLNRNFCTHLAEFGFAVISLSYRPYPQAGVLGQLKDVMAALAWVGMHMSDWPVDPNNVFLAGDSAGGTLALLATVAERNEGYATRLGVRSSGLSLRGALLISGLFDLEARAKAMGMAIAGNGPVDAVDAFGPGLFGPLFEAVGPAELSPAALATKVNLPPLFLCTSSDDFIQDNTLCLAAELARAGRRFELHDWTPEPGQALGHVFPVNMSWLPESKRMLELMKRFCYRHLA